MSGRRVPAPVRREVVERYGLVPGSSLTIACHYGCGRTTAAYWPLNRDGSPNYWPMLGRGFGLDHIVPFAVVPEHCADNLVIACGWCNTSKRERELPKHLRKTCGTTAEDLRNPDTGVHASCVSGMEGNGMEEEGRTTS